MIYNTDPGPSWHNFDKGRSIGRPGPEGGVIIVDIEHIDGARIAVEKDTPSAAFAITFGIYGLLLHTHFKSHQEEVQQSITWLRSTMDKVFDMYQQDENSRSDDWYHEHDRLVHELTID